jgi:hypothetical protein
MFMFIFFTKFVVTYAWIILHVTKKKKSFFFNLHDFCFRLLNIICDHVRNNIIMAEVTCVLTPYLGSQYNHDRNNCNRNFEPSILPKSLGLQPHLTKFNCLLVSHSFFLSLVYVHCFSILFCPFTLVLFHSWTAREIKTR